MDRDKKEHQDNGKENVVIIINSNEYTVHRGHHTVAELKALDQIPPAYELNLILDSGFDPLPDDGGVTIKGGEKFISTPRDGVSS